MINKIKSRNILKIILRNLNDKTNLNLVKYNNNLKKKLGITIKDYIEYFNQIEIEIIPKLTLDDEKEKFININKDNFIYHIYFNGNETEEINKIFIEQDENVTKIKVIINNIKNKSLKGLFKECHCIQEIKFIRFNISDVKDMSEMFSQCLSLKKINFLKFDTNLVNDMNDMFCGCVSLLNLDLSKFITTNVTNMRSMFAWCKKIKKLDLSNFNTTNVKYMTDMFYECISLNYLNFSKFDFNSNKKTNIISMFSGCNSLKKIELSSKISDFYLQEFLEKTDINSKEVQINNKKCWGLLKDMYNI